MSDPIKIIMFLAKRYGNMFPHLREDIFQIAKATILITPPDDHPNPTGYIIAVGKGQIFDLIRADTKHEYKLNQLGYLAQPSTINETKQLQLKLDLENFLDKLPLNDKEFCRLLMLGLTTTQIAQHLGVGRTTVFYQRKAIMKRLEQSGFDKIT